MKSIKVEKAVLLKKLIENKQKHKELVEKAQIGFKKVVKETLEKLLQNVEKNKPIDFKELYNLTQPMNKTTEYEQAIEMLNMSIDDIVEITDQEFRCFVQDKWDWADQAFLSNSRYIR